MTTLAAIKRRFEPGTRWAVTNHYISREDHPAYGTTERTVTRVTSAGVYLAYDDGATTRLDWPRASEVAVEPDGALTFSSHPHRPGPFLTLRPVEPTEGPR